MKMIATKTVIVKPLGAVGPFGSKTVRSGEKFECDDAQGERLIQNGHAVEKPKPKRRVPASKTAEGNQEPVGNSEEKSE